MNKKRIISSSLFIAAALTTNTSIEYMDLRWTSTHPDTTLKVMTQCVWKRTLRELELFIHMPQLSSESSVSIGEAIETEWYQRVAVGGKDFILSLKNSHLKRFSLRTYSDYFIYNYSIHSFVLDIGMSLVDAAETVNSARKKNNLPEIEFLTDVW